MKKFWLVFLCGFYFFVVFADVRNADKPLKGEWDFRPQKVWEIDSVNDEPLYTHVEKVIIRGDHCYALLEDESGKSIFAKYKIILPSIQ